MKTDKLAQVKSKAYEGVCEVLPFPDLVRSCKQFFN